LQLGDAPRPAIGRHHRRSLLAGLGAGLVTTSGLVACSQRLPAYRGDPGTPGSVAKVEHLAGYPALVLRGLIAYGKMPAPIPVSSGIDLYRISYWSRTNGQPVLVSGLMAVPQGRQPRATMLWMHGTNSDRKSSLSAPSLEGILAGAIFAGGDYLMLAPDLIGLGVSRAPQAYLYNPSTIAVTLDFLKAARTVAADLGKAWRPGLYIAGFSQGGHSTAVIHRELERRGDPAWRVKASAAIAGAYDLADITLPFAMQGRSNQDTTYLGLVAISYATYYGQPLTSILAPATLPLVRTLLDGAHTNEIKAKMPANPRSIFTPEFLADFDAGRTDWFIAAMRENAVREWAPKAPFRAYVGDADVDVPPTDARAFVARSQSLGGQAQLVDLGRFDHGGTAYHAVPQIRAWFDALSAGSAPGR
jgi:pimeloyl-ACP methyl ester carboxylesterase